MPPVVLPPKGLPHHVLAVYLKIPVILTDGTLRGYAAELLTVPWTEADAPHLDDLLQRLATAADRSPLRFPEGDLDALRQAYEALSDQDEHEPDLPLAIECLEVLASSILGLEPR